MFLSFVKRLFHWFFDLFDHKVVPKSPTRPIYHWEWWRWGESRGKTWQIKEMPHDPFGGLYDLVHKPNQHIYKGPFGFGSSSTVSTESWIPSWLWYGGIVLLSKILIMGVMILTISNKKSIY
uniref:Uncharacterized protein n=1 Tax=Phanerochaete carnosa TaxID=231932 RepID=A0A895KUU9_9APHY|nr:hypothetical protein K8K84_mgp095 [Phanerochaete carnosa]QRZ60357.1 hypothetical protein [Phanerochaete carnosa]